MERLISDADPAIAFTDFLQTMQALPERSLSQPRVVVSHRMADVPYAERIAWLASRKAGLEYWLDVHDTVLRLASSALPPGDPVYAITVAKAPGPRWSFCLDSPDILGESVSGHRIAFLL